jgi:hypothetical protein
LQLQLQLQLPLRRQWQDRRHPRLPLSFELRRVAIPVLGETD